MGPTSSRGSGPFRVIWAGLLLGVAVLTLVSAGGVLVPSGEGVAAEPEYVGAKSCKKCHFRQYKTWSKTRMASSMDALKPGTFAEAKKKHNLDPKKDYSRDGDCLGCHTTGYGKKGGFPAVVDGQAWTEEENKRASRMGGVQCEACHGPHSLINPYKKKNKDYKRADLLKMGLHEPNKKNCVLCHNQDNPTAGKDYKLDYDALVKDPKKLHKHKKLKHKH